MPDRARGTGPLGFMLRVGPPPPAAKYTDNLSDRLALHAFPQDKLEELERLCDASPAMAPGLIKFAVELLDIGIEVGYSDAIDEIATGSKNGSLPSEGLSKLMKKYG